MCLTKKNQLRFKIQTVQINPSGARASPKQSANLTHVRNSGKIQEESFYREQPAVGEIETKLR